MQTYAEEHKIMAQPRRSLIGNMKGEKILLATPHPQVVPGTWFRGHQSGLSDRVHP